jgi:mannose-6-phosphate isomerase-like protein (cupin superfamily)
MQTSTFLGEARIIHAGELEFVPLPGRKIAIATPVSPEIGSHHITLHVIRITPGESWSPPRSAAEENTAVVFAGSGTARVGGRSQAAEPAAAAYAPTGLALTLTAGEEELTAYVWRAPLIEGRRPSASPTVFSTLWDETTQLRGFAGTGQVTPDARRATMNFVFWPGTGSSQLCLHCGVQQPGETFNVHLHDEADEAFIAFEGVGQMYLADRWVDVSAGDVLYAAPRVLHGARNPQTGPGARRFVTCGGPAPFDPVLYAAAGLTTEVK